MEHGVVECFCVKIHTRTLPPRTHSLHSFNEAHLSLLTMRNMSSWVAPTLLAWTARTCFPCSSTVALAQASTFSS